MKYQPQHDVIDPEVPPPENWTLEPEGARSDAPTTTPTSSGSTEASVQVPTSQPAKKSKRRLKAWVQPLGIVLDARVRRADGLEPEPAPRRSAAPPPPSPFQVKQALYLGVMKIDAYRRGPRRHSEHAQRRRAFPRRAATATSRIDPQHYVLSFRGERPEARVRLEHLEGALLRFAAGNLVDGRLEDER